MGASSAAMTVRETSEQLQEWTPRFVMSVDDAVDLVKQKREFFERVMKDGQHYGRIPGMPKDAKPALFKAGAELLNAAMGLHPVLSDAELPVRDYSGEQHNREPFWSFRKTCRIYRQTGPGENDRMIVAEADGSCNSWEVKYRYRIKQAVCPACGIEAIRQSKPPKDEPDKTELGFYCWRKIGGCGANFHHDDQRILEQTLGRIPNPDIFDLENTGLKMSGKRALVATTLIATGCSDLFTQDLEDRVDDDTDPGPAANDSAGIGAPAAKKTATGSLTAEQRAELEGLNKSLPNPVDPKLFDAMLKAGPGPAAKALLSKHAEQCCKGDPAIYCPHMEPYLPKDRAGEAKS